MRGDAETALGILRAMAIDPTDWTVDGTIACIEVTWFRVTKEQVELLDRLRDEALDALADG